MLEKNIRMSVKNIENFLVELSDLLEFVAP